MQNSEVLADSTIRQKYLNVQTELMNMKTKITSTEQKTEDEEKKADEQPSNDKKRYEKALEGMKEAAGKSWEWVKEHKKPLLYT
jgi:ribonuclease HI